MTTAERAVTSSVLTGYRHADLPVAESAFTAAERLRLAVRGLAIGLALVALCVVIAAVLTSALFDYPGDLS